MDYKRKEQMNIISNQFRFQIENADSENLARRFLEIERYDEYHARTEKEMKELLDSMKHPYANLSFEDFENLMDDPDEMEKFNEYMEKQKQRLQKARDEAERFHGTIFAI